MRCCTFLLTATSALFDDHTEGFFPLLSFTDCAEMFNIRINTDLILH